jgi:photosynthetic reaction center cytochrome c subunit
MRKFAIGCVTLSALFLTGCWERPPIESSQNGYRGTAMGEMVNPRLLAVKQAANVLPEVLPPALEGGPTAGSIYKNVPVLGHLSVAEFTRTMVSITNWIAPKEGCNYCHKVNEDFSVDNVYTKVVARRMLQMTMAINSDWKNHVIDTGVTCYTCHRGNAVPANLWFSQLPERQASRMTGGDAGQNRPGKAVGLTSLPYDPFSLYLSKAQDIRVVSTTALPSGSMRNIKQTESTYALMVHMSDGLGVNCTYCHNTQAFSSWATSTPQRVTAWYGINLVRELNNNFMEPLTPVFPANRKGPAGDVGKINCTTCHQGVFKPLLGAKLVKDFPGLVSAAAPVVAPVVVATGKSKVRK